MKYLSLLFVIVVGLSIYIGGLLGIKFNKKEKMVNFNISITFGIILGLILFKILPSTYEMLNEELGFFRSIFAIIVLILIGIFILKIIDLFIPNHPNTNKRKQEKNINKQLFHIGIMFYIVITIYNVIEGMSIYIKFSNNFKLGLVLTIVVLLTNILISFFTIFSFTKLGYSIKKILNLIFFISFAPLLGSIIIIILGTMNYILYSILFGIIMGMFIYILLFEFLKYIYFIKNKKTIKVGCVLGIIISILIFILEKI